VARKRLSMLAGVVDIVSQHDGYRQVFAPGAFDEAVRTLAHQSAPLRVCVDHDVQMELGRWPDVTARVVPEGLVAQCDLPANDFGDQVAEHVFKRDFGGCSVWCGLDRDDFSYHDAPADGGSPVILVKRVSALWELGPVLTPAFGMTEATLGGLVFVDGGVRLKAMAEGKRLRSSLGPAAPVPGWLQERFAAVHADTREHILGLPRHQAPSTPTSSTPGVLARVNSVRYVCPGRATVS
jgi:HK97 family phage prohead protease